MTGMLLMTQTLAQAGWRYLWLVFLPAPWDGKVLQCILHSVRARSQPMPNSCTTHLRLFSQPPIFERYFGPLGLKDYISSLLIS